MSTAARALGGDDDAAGEAAVRRGQRLRLTTTPVARSLEAHPPRAQARAERVAHGPPETASPAFGVLAHPAGREIQLAAADVGYDAPTVDLHVLEHTGPGEGTRAPRSGRARSSERSHRRERATETCPQMRRHASRYWMWRTSPSGQRLTFAFNGEIDEQHEVTAVAGMLAERLVVGHRYQQVCRRTTFRSARARSPRR